MNHSSNENAVLIISSQGDDHAIVVSQALTKLGSSSIVWWTSDFPLPQTHSFAVNQENVSLRVSDTLHGFDYFSACWIRRPHARGVDRNFLHANDVQYVETTLSAYHRSLWNMIAAEPQRFGLKVDRWINHPRAIDRGESKLLQLSLARDCGFHVPNTLISNDKDEIFEFVSKCSNGAIRKSLVPFTWVEGSSKLTNAASGITISDLNQIDSIGAFPEIYQEKIVKVAEHRVLCLGDNAISVRFTAGKYGDDTVDWRYAHKYIEELGNVVDLPSEVAKSCIEMCGKIGLATASFDLVETEDGRFYFLELNQAGQFLWMEMAGVPVLDMMSRFLLDLPIFDVSGERVALKEIMSSSAYKDQISKDRTRIRRSADRVLLVSD